MHENSHRHRADTHSCIIIVRYRGKQGDTHKHRGNSCQTAAEHTPSHRTHHSQFGSIQFSPSVVFDSLRPHGLQHTRLPCPSPTPRIYPNSPSIESVMPSNHLILCRPLLLPSIFPSISVFSNESVLHVRWPKYWSFSFQHQSFQCIFRTDFL